DGGGDIYDLEDMFAAVYDVMREFNNVGGTTATVDFGGNSTDARAYDAGTPFNDPAPTIHIGFTDKPYDIESSGTAKASTKYLPDAKCTINEARITFLNLNLQPWNFGTPGDVGQKTYTATDYDSTAKMWFRPVMQHELLHAFGLAHSHT